MLDFGFVEKRCKSINISIYKITEDHPAAVNQTKNDNM